MANSFIQVPPDGSGKKIYTNQQVVSGVTVQVQGVNIVSGNDPTSLLNIDDKGAIYTRFFEGDPILGAYGDLKILQERILGVYEHTIDSYDDLFLIQEISGGTSTWNIDESSVLLETTTDFGSKCARITNRYHYYQPGISFLVTIACSCSDTGITNNRRQWGLFADNYGYFFELSGTTINVVLRSNISGPIIEQRIPQSSWNINKLDGTGYGNINLDVSKSYQYFINVNFPSNIVSFGVYDAIFGRIICHKFYISGTSALPEIRHATLPVQFNNENIGVTVSTCYLREIMAVVLTEGEPDYTFWRFSDLGCTHQIVSQPNTPIFSVRAKVLLDNGKHNHVNTFPESISVYSSGSTIKLNIIQVFDDQLTGATWTLDSIGGPLQGDSGATLVDFENSYNFKSFFIQKNVPTNINVSDIFELNDEGIVLGADNLTQQIMTFVATPLDGNVADISFDLSYRALY